MSNIVYKVTFIHCYNRIYVFYKRSRSSLLLSKRVPSSLIALFIAGLYCISPILYSLSDTPKLGSSGNSLSMSLTMPNPASAKQHNTSYTNPWLASEASKHRMDITDVLPGSTMPVNSIDIVGNTLLCGTDAEQIVMVRNLVIK